MGFVDWPVIIICPAHSQCLPAAIIRSASAPVRDLSRLRKDAQRGNPDAQFQLGWSYQTGNGTELDYVQAAYWYRRSADRGNPLRGDPFFQLDLRMSKNIKIREGMNLQLIGQVFNLTNRANYGNNYTLSIADPTTFGHPAGFINPSSTFMPRSLWSEFGVRFTF